MSNASLIRRKQIERQAEGYLELGMPRQAIENLDRLGGENGLGPHGLYLRGEALKDLGRYEEAVALLEKAAQAMPGTVELLLSLGWCYKRSGRIERAVQSMQQALVYKPQWALVHYNLSCYLSLAGNKRRALAHLSRAIELDPEFRPMVDNEPDFDPIRCDPDFQALLGLRV